MSCIVTYQKSNGELFIRPYDCSAFALGKKVGDETSMGWKIVDIHYKYKDNFYCYSDYMKILDREIREKKNKKMIRFMIKKLSKFA